MFVPVRPLPLTAGVLTVALALACDGLTEPEDPGVHFLVTEALFDTVGGFIQEVEVEVRASRGRPVPGAAVRVVGPAGNPPPVRLGLHRRSWWSGTTGDDGRARVSVYAGEQSGTYELVARTPSGTSADTVTVTVLAGGPAGLAASPADTAVRVGGGYTLRVMVTDRFGNGIEVAGNVTVVSRDSAARVVGRQVTGVTPGRSQLALSERGYRGTAAVTVVPEGRVAATYNGGIRLFDLDGSNMQTLVPEGSYPEPGGLDWNSEGTELLFHEERARLAGQVLRRVGLSGAVERVTTGTPDHAEIWPEYTDDGAWIYYMAFRQTGSSVWRCRPDGSEAGRVPGLVSVEGYNEGPGTVSPDGTRMVFVRRPPIVTEPVLAMLDLATGAVVDSSITYGHLPRWSPVGRWIAFEARNFASYPRTDLALLDADSFAVRETGVENFLYRNRPDWSPDGRWLIIANQVSDRIELVDPVTGQVLPLPFTTGYDHPAWQP